MKLFIAALLASSLASPAVAGDYEGMLLCAVMAEGARSVMYARQVGVSMTTLMELAEKEKSVTEEAQELILNAYSQKREHTEEDQQRAIEAFESATYLQCTREMREKAE